jgi:predicted 3-demethylubiquinone-9 3-methyltransferase (glyoxalase superfamily)
MQKITPCLWFDTQAEDAAKFYTSIFKNSRILSISKYPESAEEVSGKPAGSVMTVEFEIDGMRFTGLNGGPNFKFSEAISFQIDCKDQAEVDYFSEKLTANGGEQGPCGWVKDRFGLSWQVVPSIMAELFGGPDKEGAERAMKAMLEMKKLDITKLQAAYDGK